MKHPFDVLGPKYAQQIGAMRLDEDRRDDLDAICKTLLRKKDVYQLLSDRTLNKIPVAFLMAIAYREMSGDTNCFLGNGQRLSLKTTIVPKVLGPWLQPYPENFLAGALVALRIDAIDQVSDWSLARATYESETLNGWGYLNHGLPSPYVFGGTSIQQKGKYTTDGHLDMSVMDSQLGTVAIMESLFEHDPSLKFGDEAVKTEEAPTLVLDLPLGLGGGINVFLLQKRLNDLKVNGTPIRVDGYIGKNTTRVVRAFQYTHGLDADGIIGPKTIAALKM